MSVDLRCVLMLILAGSLAGLPAVAADAPPAEPAPLASTPANLKGEKVELSSDASLFDGKANQGHYEGNVRISIGNNLLTADEMISEGSPSEVVSRVQLKGAPARLTQLDPATSLRTEAEAAEIDYDAVAGRIALRGRVAIKQTSADGMVTEVSASELQVRNVNGRAEEMVTRGEPATLTRNKAGEAPMTGSANTITYVASRQFVQLEGAARLSQGRDSIEHEIIEYDGLNLRTSTPYRPGTQMRTVRQGEKKTEPAGKEQK